MPLVKLRVFQYLCELASQPSDASHDDWAAIVPRVNGYAQPLHALYRPSVLPALQKRLAAGERRATSFLEDVRVRWVDEAEIRPLDPALESFFNANTPEEWAEAIQLLRSEEGVNSEQKTEDRNQ